MKKYSGIFVLLFLSLANWGQSLLTIQKEINILNYRDSINYWEGTIKIRDTLFTEVFYQYSDTSNVHIHSLDIIILNTSAAFKKKKFNFPSDSLIVKAKYRYNELFISSHEVVNGRVFGRMEIVELTRRKATVKFDLYAFDFTGKEKIKFIGTRTFRKKTLLEKLFNR